MVAIFMQTKLTNYSLVQVNMVNAVSLLVFKWSDMQVDIYFFLWRHVSKKICCTFVDFQEPTEDYSIVGNELNLRVPSFTIGGHDDLSVADNLSVASGEELAHSWASGMVNGHQGDVGCQLHTLAAPEGSAAEGEVSTDVEDTTEDEEGQGKL